MSTPAHRDTSARFPDAPRGTCIHCYEPCRPDLRAHTACRERATTARDYRAKMIEREGGAEALVCTYTHRGKCAGPIEAHHVKELADNGPHDWTVPACKKHHQERTNEARAARKARTTPQRTTTTRGSTRMASTSKPKGKTGKSGGSSDDETVYLILAVLFVAGGGAAALSSTVHQKVAALFGSATTATAHAKGVTPSAYAIGVQERWHTIVPWLPLIGIVLVLCVVAAIRLKVNERHEARLAEVIARASNTDPEVIRVRVRTRLTRGSARLAPTFDDAPGSAARARVEEAIERKVNADLEFTWNTRTDTVTWRPGYSHTEPEPYDQEAHEPQRPSSAGENAAAIIDRVQAALRAFAKSDQVYVSCVGEPDKVGPTGMRVTYPENVRDDLPETRAAWQNIVGSKAPERWRPSWDTHGNVLTLTRRPPMPSHVPHPAPTDKGNTWRLPFAMTEDHTAAAWDLKVAPHALVAGETGSGKTVLLRAVVTEACARGFLVNICDPKRVEMSGFRGWPGVAHVATSTEDMIALVQAMHLEMDRRYEAIEEDGADPESFRPILLVIDEAREWIDRVNAAWKANKVQGQSGTEHPVVEQWRSIARLGRTARIHLLVGIQRPDAKVFGGEARDNYGARMALGSLSEQGARMMFGSADVGRDVPAEAKGRVTVDLGRGVAEAQTWWTPDAGGDLSPADRDILAALRPAGVPAPTPPQDTPVARRSGYHDPSQGQDDDQARQAARRVGTATAVRPSTIRWVQRAPEDVEENDVVRRGREEHTVEGVTIDAITSEVLLWLEGESEPWIRRPDEPVDVQQ